MFLLTPQEKTALAGLLTVCLLGAAIHLALAHNFRPMQWANVAAQPVKAPRARKPKGLKKKFPQKHPGQRKKGRAYDHA